MGEEYWSVVFHGVKLFNLDAPLGGGFGRRRPQPKSSQTATASLPPSIPVVARLLRRPHRTAQRRGLCEGEMQAATSTAAGDGAGGGAGGRCPDEAWREELAAAWGQTNAERGTLRSQYAAVRADIRGKFAFPPRRPRRCSAIRVRFLMCVCDCRAQGRPSSPRVRHHHTTMDRIEKLHEKGGCFSRCLFSFFVFPSLFPS